MFGRFGVATGFDVAFRWIKPHRLPHKLHLVIFFDTSELETISLSMPNIKKTKPSKSRAPP